MKKLLIAASAAVLFSGAYAQESEKPEIEKTDDVPVLEAGFDVDFFTSYVWRNAVQSDRPVAQPCVWADFTFADPFYFGFYVWQNYDLTSRRRDTGMRGEWNETDYNVHAGTALWASDDEETSLNLEIGHEWFSYCVHGDTEDDLGNPYRKRKDYPTTYEMYLKLELENPFATPYAQVSYEYNRVDGIHYELGLKKEIAFDALFSTESDVLSQFTLFGDVNVNFGSKKYLTWLYDGDDEDDVELKRGLGGFTAKGGVMWSPCEHFSVGGMLAFTSILNKDARGEFRKMEDYCNSPDQVWGGLQAKLSF